MDFLSTIWGKIKDNPGKAIAGASVVAAAGGYTVAPWVNVLASLLTGGQ